MSRSRPQNSWTRPDANLISVFAPQNAANALDAHVVVVRVCAYLHLPRFPRRLEGARVVDLACIGPMGARTVEVPRSRNNRTRSRAVRADANGV